MGNLATNIDSRHKKGVNPKSMDSIKIRKEQLFKEWRSIIGDEFCINGGLQFRGNFLLCEPFDDKCMWNREEGNEEMLWKESAKRILILTKDLNEPEDTWDIRVESCGRKAVPVNHKNTPIVKHLNGSFYRKLKRWVYGILKSNTEYDIPIFEYVQKNPDELAMFYEQAPWVRINCKIKSGGNSVSDSELSSYITRDAKFLSRQIRIYQPNVIICCGHRKGENVIIDQLVRKMYPDLCMVENTGEWVYYSKESNILVIDTYHPAATINGDEWQYNELLTNFYRAVDLVGFVFSSL